MTTYNHDEVVGWCGSVIGTVSTAFQENPILHNIQAILTIIAILVSISYTIWKWWKKASKDGKITKDEVEELFDDLKGDKKDGSDN